jgi:ATP adenylyltransferase/5',5'''-P-1,P-4-tetraphosphate phosphorylase II
VLNKFCVVRPQFVLHTVEYEHQDQGLNDGDLRAGWEALRALGDGYMVIFNGGEDAGASVAHKHLQIIPKAGHIDQILRLVKGREGGGGECGCEMFVASTVLIWLQRFATLKDCRISMALSRFRMKRLMRLCLVCIQGCYRSSIRDRTNLTICCLRANG